ncbi:MAG: PhoPQ-activated protein PqaA family protein [Fimbriimonadaceae bacterium]
MSFSLLAALAIAPFTPAVPTELSDYLKKPDSVYAFEVGKDQNDTMISLTSQTWQGNVWKHNLLIRDNAAPIKKGVAVLFITGNGPNPGDRLLIPAVSGATKLPTAFLFGIPNQPLYGFTEDELIAYTFDKYLETQDASWPLLFPMTKSVLRAMDAIEESTKNSSNPIKKFVISGASKRGWTTWLTGASGDKRVVAIAPMVIDNLNLSKQMAHQMDIWGQYSEQIEAYTKRGLQAKFTTQAGKHLGEIVDPYSYRSQIKVPTLIITGSNDPYWAADACSQYYDDLKMPKWLVTVPNVGHNLGGGAQAIETFGKFCEAVALDKSMPQEKWSMKRVGADQLEVSLSSSRVKLQKLVVWGAESATLDFKESKFVSLATVEVGPGSTSVKAVIALPKNSNAAIFGEATYVDGSTYRLCCPTQIYRKSTSN